MGQPERREPEREGRVTRRRFCVALGGSLALSGWVLGRAVTSEPTEPEPAAGSADARPRLRADLAWGRDGEFRTLTRVVDGEPLVCGLNDAGAALARGLDGRHTVCDLSAALSARRGVRHDDALEARVALFVAQVSMLGLLTEPFYAWIVERTEAGRA